MIPVPVRCTAILPVLIERWRSNNNGLNLTSGVRFGFYAAESPGIRKAAVPIDLRRLCARDCWPLPQAYSVLAKCRYGINPGKRDVPVPSTPRRQSPTRTRAELAKAIGSVGGTS